MTSITSSLRPVASLDGTAEAFAASATACPFCLEEVKAGASVCKHCGSTISPVHRLMLAHAALEGRLAAIEVDLAALRQVPPEDRARATDATVDGSAERRTGWPHMFDNLFLGLAALLVAHWLASTVPHHQYALYRMVAVVVALPFGYRYEIYARATTSAQVGAAAVFGALGGLLIATLDVATSGEQTRALGAVQGREVVQTIVVIGLSHLTGSWLAWWRRREQRREAAVAAMTSRRVVSAGLALVLRMEPDRIKKSADAIHSVVESSAPVAAAAATLWAAFGRLLF